MKADRAVVAGSGGRKTLPFVVDKTSSASLPDQFVEGVRRAIDNGYYRAGDRLPTWRELSQALGVSERIPREAMARLVREGLVVSHRRIGCVIATNVVQRAWSIL